MLCADNTGLVFAGLVTIIIYYIKSQRICITTMNSDDMDRLSTVTKANHI